MAIKPVMTAVAIMAATRHVHVMATQSVMTAVAMMAATLHMHVMATVPRVAVIHHESEAYSDAI